MTAPPQLKSEGKAGSAGQPDGYVSFNPISSASTLVPNWTTTTKAGDSPDDTEVDALPTAGTTFTSANDIFSLAYATNGDALVVAPTSVDNYHALEKLRDQRSSKLRLFYLADHAILIVTVPTADHEQFHLQLNKQVFMAMGGMGLQRDWNLVGGTKFRSVTGSGSAGEGDSGGKPRSRRRGKWPTLVIEAGWTQSLESLRMKKNFWFKDSNHEVKIVILVKGYPNNDSNAGAEKRVLLEHWQEPALIERPGATQTRLHAAASRDSMCLQTINIVWAGPVPYKDASEAVREDPHNFNVTRGPLQLDFAGLFLREPAAGTNENDIILDDSALQSYAAEVWSQ